MIRLRHVPSHQGSTTRSSYKCPDPSSPSSSGSNNRSKAPSAMIRGYYSLYYLETKLTESQKLGVRVLLLCCLCCLCCLCLVLRATWLGYHHSGTVAVAETSSTSPLFGFSGEEDYAYRLGDVFVLWYLIEYDITFDELERFYGRHFPGTIGHEYLVETQQVTNLQGGDPAFRNITALLHILDRREQSRHTHSNSHSSIRLARPGEIVIHLRLGDVLTKEDYIDLDKTMEDLWLADQGWVNKDGRVKNNYNLVEYQELIERLPSHKKFQTCVIVGASSFLADANKDSRNQEYKTLVADFFQHTLSCDIEFYSNENPDETLMFMASAEYLIAGLGGFSQIATACVRARRGRTHAIYDPFNGRVAGAKDKRFRGKEKLIYAKEYIDWSQVTYVRPPRYYQQSDE